MLHSVLGIVLGKEPTNQGVRSKVAGGRDNCQEQSLPRKEESTEKHYLYQPSQLGICFLPRNPPWETSWAGSPESHSIVCVEGGEGLELE